jgi:hypothetical protein
MKCGLGWVCPVCATRLSEQRRDLLQRAIDNSRDKYLPVLVTYTVQHHKGDDLAELLDLMASAYRKMRQQRLWRAYKDEYLIAGETRALEITWGDNGWHPHYHVVLWLELEVLNAIKDERGKMDVDHLCAALERHLSGMWIDALAKVGLRASDSVGLTVRSTDDLLNDYVTKGGTVLPDDGAKWGIASEVTKGAQKRGRVRGKTPWDLLIEHWAGMPNSGTLFFEYASATRGKSSMQWTPGMLDRLGVAYDEDAELHAEEAAPDEILLAAFDADQWHKIVVTRAVGEILDLAASGDPDRIARAYQVIARRYEQGRRRD